MARLTPEEIEVERVKRRPAAYAAFVAAFLTLASGIGSMLFSQQLPQNRSAVVDLAEALGARLVDGTAPPISLNALQVQYIGDHLLGWLTPAIGNGLSTAIMVVPLLLVFSAARARKDDLRPLGGYVLAVGAVVSGLGLIVTSAAAGLNAADFTGTAAADARDAFGSGLPGSLALPTLVAQMLLAVGMIIVSLNAMRVGLFTRFVGILGVIAGAASVIGAGLDQIGLLRSSWLLFVGLTLIGRMPGVSANPPAWDRGEMIAWPTQQELREMREAEAASEDPVALGAQPVAEGTSRKSRKRR